VSTTPDNLATFLPPIIYIDSLTPNQRVRINGVNSGDSLGSSSCASGDTDGNGFNNVMMCAPYNTYSGAGAGTCYDVNGGTVIGVNGVLEVSSLDGTTGIAYHGKPSDSLAYSCGYLGDFRRDGYPMLAFGSTASSPGGLLYAGNIYTVAPGRIVPSNGHYLVSNINATTGCVASGPQAGDSIGYKVTSAVVTPDGKPSLVSGASSATRLGRTSVGMMSVEYGSPSACPGGSFSVSNSNTSLGFSLVGLSGGDYTATNIVSLNYNGTVTLVMNAAQAAPHGITGAGRLYNIPLSAISGNATGDLAQLSSSQYGTVNGKDPNSYFSVKFTKGNFDGSGQPQLAVGSTGASPGGQAQSGQIDVFFSPPTSGVTEQANSSTARIIGAPAGAQAGYVAALDFDNDGFDEVAVGGPYASMAWLVRGGLNIKPNTTISVSYVNPRNCSQFVGTPGTYFSYSMATPGDMNGDKVADWLVCSFNGSPGGRIGAGYCDLIYGDVSPIINRNVLTIPRCGTVVYNSTFLNVTDFNHPSANFTYLPNIRNGYFHLVNTSLPISWFTGPQFDNNQVLITDSCNPSPVSLGMAVNTTGIAYRPEEAATVTTLRTSPPTPVPGTGQIRYVQGQSAFIVTFTNFDCTSVYPDQAHANLRACFALQNFQFTSSVDGSQVFCPPLSALNASNPALNASYVLGSQVGTGVPSGQWWCEDDFNLTSAVNPITFTYITPPGIAVNFFPNVNQSYTTTPVRYPMCSTNLACNSSSVPFGAVPVSALRVAIDPNSVANAVIDRSSNPGVGTTLDFSTTEFDACIPGLNPNNGTQAPTFRFSCYNPDNSTFVGGQPLRSAWQTAQSGFNDIPVPVSATVPAIPSIPVRLTRAMLFASENVYSGDPANIVDSMGIEVLAINGGVLSRNTTSGMVPLTVGSIIQQSEIPATPAQGDIFFTANLNQVTSPQLTVRFRGRQATPPVTVTMPLTHVLPPVPTTHQVRWVQGQNSFVVSFVNVNCTSPYPDTSRSNMRALFSGLQNFQFTSSIDGSVVTNATMPTFDVDPSNPGSGYHLLGSQVGTGIPSGYVECVDDNSLNLGNTQTSINFTSITAPNVTEAFVPYVNQSVRATLCSTEVGCGSSSFPAGVVPVSSLRVAFVSGTVTNALIDSSTNPGVSQLDFATTDFDSCLPGITSTNGNAVPGASFYCYNPDPTTFVNGQPLRSATRSLQIGVYNDQPAKVFADVKAVQNKYVQMTRSMVFCTQNVYPNDPLNTADNVGIGIGSLTDADIFRNVSGVMVSMTSGPTDPIIHQATELPPNPAQGTIFFRADGSTVTPNFQAFCIGRQTTAPFNVPVDLTVNFLAPILNINGNLYVNRGQPVSLSNIVSVTYAAPAGAPPLSATKLQALLATTQLQFNVQYATVTDIRSPGVTVTQCAPSDLSYMQLNPINVRDANGKWIAPSLSILAVNPPSANASADAVPVTNVEGFRSIFVNFNAPPVTPVISKSIAKGLTRGVPKALAAEKDLNCVSPGDDPSTVKISLDCQGAVVSSNKTGAVLSAGDTFSPLNMTAPNRDILITAPTNTVPTCLVACNNFDGSATQTLVFPEFEASYYPPSITLSNWVFIGNYGQTSFPVGITNLVGADDPGNAPQGTSASPLRYFITYNGTSCHFQLGSVPSLDSILSNFPDSVINNGLYLVRDNDGDCGFSIVANNTAGVPSGSKFVKASFNLGAAPASASTNESFTDPTPRNILSLIGLVFTVGGVVYKCYTARKAITQDINELNLKGFTKFGMQELRSRVTITRTMKTFFSCACLCTDDRKMRKYASALNDIKNALKTMGVKTMLRGVDDIKGEDNKKKAEDLKGMADTTQAGGKATKTAERKELADDRTTRSETAARVGATTQSAVSAVAAAAGSGGALAVGSGSVSTPTVVGAAAAAAMAIAGSDVSLAITPDAAALAVPSSVAAAGTAPAVEAAAAVSAVSGDVTTKGAADVLLPPPSSPNGDKKQDAEDDYLSEEDMKFLLEKVVDCIKELPVIKNRNSCKRLFVFLGCVRELNQKDFNGYKKDAKSRSNAELLASEVYLRLPEWFKKSKPPMEPLAAKDAERLSVHDEILDECADALEVSVELRDAKDGKDGSERRALITGARSDAAPAVVSVADSDVRTLAKNIAGMQEEFGTMKRALGGVRAALRKNKRVDDKGGVAVGGPGGSRDPRVVTIGSPKFVGSAGGPASSRASRSAKGKGDAEAVAITIASPSAGEGAAAAAAAATPTSASSRSIAAASPRPGAAPTSPDSRAPLLTFSGAGRRSASASGAAAAVAVAPAPAARAAVSGSAVGRATGSAAAIEMVDVRVVEIPLVVPGPPPAPAPAPESVSAPAPAQTSAVAPVPVLLSGAAVALAPLAPLPLLGAAPVPAPAPAPASEVAGDGDDHAPPPPPPRSRTSTPGV